MQSVQLGRRRWIRLAGAAGLAAAMRRVGAAPTPLFDGRTLDGWIQIENSAMSVATAEIIDPAAFAGRLSKGADAMPVFLRNTMPDALRADLAAYDPKGANSKTVISALVKYLNQVIGGPSIVGHVGAATLDIEPKRIAAHHPQGYELACLNKLVLEDAFPDLLRSSPTQSGWIVKDGAMASTGAGRGVIYTARDYNRFRQAFTMRHVSGNPDHQACVLIFCQRPQHDEKPLDALGGIQFQVPNGGHWDYRPGRNNDGGNEFTRVTQVRFDPHEWSRVEIVADGANGTARMAVAQPVGSKGIEVLSFRDPTAGRTGPIAWQMHNAGLFDEYRDVSIEIDPKEMDLVTTR